MRILHVFDHSIPLQSGYSFRSRAILLEQRRRSWETYHLTSGKQGSLADAIDVVDDLEFHRTAAPPKWLHGMPLVDHLAITSALATRLLQLARNIHPDIIHAHSPALNGIAALRVGKQLGIPVVYEIRAFWEDAAVDHGTSTLNGWRYRATRRLETHVARRADAVTTICDGLREDLVKRGIDEGKLTIIPNAVNADNFDYDSPRDAELVRQFGLEAKPVIGFIGSFYAYEGICDLIRAVPKIVEAVPDVRVMLVGSGPDHKEVLRLIESLEIEDSVTCTGRVEHREVSKYYSLLDVLCYPRVPMRLTDLVTPLKPLEAMAQGKIVVASDVGGHRELITHDKTGVLYPAGDTNAFARTVIEVLKDRSNWEALKSAGRDYVETERNWARSVSAYEPLYDRVLKRKPELART